MWNIGRRKIHTDFGWGKPEGKRQLRRPRGR
jgi:hypothetical protein